MKMTRWLAVAGVAGAFAGLGARGIDDAMESLVRAERAFARMSVETSQREAFLANFADEGVWFTPAPANTRRALQRSPVASGAPATTLDWEPVTGDVAASGDLGYTTGPWVSRDASSGAFKATGWFFSVWRREGDAAWKVMADFGIQGAAVPAGLRPRVFQRAEVRAVGPAAQAAAGAYEAELEAADSEFGGDASVRGPSAAYADRATADVRVLRQKLAPLVGTAAVRTFAGAQGGRLTWQPAFACASAAGDLGYTYGSYVQSPPSGPELRGYYLHVWKRGPAGWRLAADVTN